MNSDNPPKRVNLTSVWVAVDQNATVHEDCARKHSIHAQLELLLPFAYRCYICGKRIGFTETGVVPAGIPMAGNRD